MKNFSCYTLNGFTRNLILETVYICIKTCPVAWLRNATIDLSSKFFDNDVTRSQCKYMFVLFPLSLFFYKEENVSEMDTASFFG